MSTLKFQVRNVIVVLQLNKWADSYDSKVLKRVRLEQFKKETLELEQLYHPQRFKKVSNNQLAIINCSNSSVDQEFLDGLANMCQEEDDTKYQETLELSWFLAEEKVGCVETTAVRIV